MTERECIALRIAQQYTDITTLNVGEYGYRPLVVMSFGAGMMMAFCDHIRKEYPWMSVLALDLPGSKRAWDRVITIDWLATAFPSVLILWSSIRSATGYAEFLKERDFHANESSWLYLRGYGEEDAPLWESFGFTLLDTPFAPAVFGTDEEARRRFARNGEVLLSTERLQEFIPHW